jgi:hypothetical protein
MQNLKSTSKIINSENMIFMTNGCCETAKIKQTDLKKHNLEFQKEHVSCDTWYPLTKKEELFIGEDFCKINSELYGNMAYSLLYEGKKWLGVEFTVAYADGEHEDELSKESAAKENLNICNILLIIAYEVNGLVAWSEEVAHEYEESSSEIDGEYSSYLLIPFDYAFNNAKDFNEWKEHIIKTSNSILKKNNELKTIIGEDGALKVICENQMALKSESTLGDVTDSIISGMVHKLNESLDYRERLSSEDIEGAYHMLTDEFGENSLLPIFK